jgi:hypothetical protein
VIWILFVLMSSAEWQPLFDGRTLQGWMWSFDSAANIRPSWEASEGTLRTSKSGEEVYLLTRESFQDFEFEFEWNASPGANSGVKYRFQGYGDSKSGRIEPIGLEYQITDDLANPDALSTPRHSAGALYDYVAPDKAVPARPQVWHRARIVAHGNHIEHWLDGKRVVNIDLDSPHAVAEFAKSTRRSAPMLRQQEKRDSPLALQFHDGDVRFRRLRIRKI